MYVNLVLLGIFVFVYSTTAGRLERTSVNGAMLFMAFGLVLGPFGMDILRFEIAAEGIRTIAEVTLAFVLFTDAASANLEELKKSLNFPQRLLLIGLPLTILLGFGIGSFVFSGLTLIEIAILATMLAPTDAALGKAVVSNESVSVNIREGLNAESGLNDGICVPIFFVFLTLATGANTGGGVSMLVLKLVAQQIGIGIAVGSGVTILGAWLLRRYYDRGWVTETWRQLPVPSLAVVCFAMAQCLGGSGFIAAFIGGLLFGGIVKRHKQSLLLAAEGTGDTLALLTWVIFGSAVVGQTVTYFSLEIVLYALLSLTVVRMLPVFLVLGEMNLRTDEKLFVGWFGPRGLASIVLAVIVLDSQLPGGDIIVTTVVCTVAMSVIGHGFSANPLVAALAARNTHVNKKKVNPTP